MTVSHMHCRTSFISDPSPCCRAIGLIKSSQYLFIVTMNALINTHPPKVYETVLYPPNDVATLIVNRDR